MISGVEGVMNLLEISWVGSILAAVLHTRLDFGLNFVKQEIKEIELTVASST